MRSRVAAVAVLAVLSGPTVSHADSIARIGPPKELPPASFAGPQYVDSRGCVYMRAGYNGVVKWVPRIDDAHDVLCGYQPTFGAGQPAPLAVAAAPAPLPAPTPTPAPVAVAAAAVPVAAPAPQVPSPPPGYVNAWQDGRLNPLRAQGTPEGEAAMYRVWTRTVPMKGIVPDGAAPQNIVPAAYEAPAPAAATRLSTMNGPVSLPAPKIVAAAPAQAAGQFVQVGSFAVAANAAGAAARLRALGLPVVMAPGRALQSVMAGPFADPAAAEAALQAVHGAGFGDAFLRG